MPEKLDPIIETPEQILLNEIRQQPDFQQIVIQEYSAETKYLPKKILNQTRQIHQSKSLSKRVDVVRQWKPIKRLFKIVGYSNEGSKLEIRTEIKDV